MTTLDSTRGKGTLEGLCRKEVAPSLCWVGKVLWILRLDKAN